MTELYSNQLKRALAAALCVAGLASSPLARAASPDKPFLEEFPDVKKFLYTEPHSPVYLGFGISPIAIMSTKVFFSADMFEVNYITPRWDINILSASLGLASGKVDYANSRHFTFRVAPKFRVMDYISIGPMIGLEFVEFPNLQARINKGGYFSPFEPFSSHGIIFGGEASELFHLSKDVLFKVSEMVYKQTYSTTTTENDWKFNFERDDVNQDSTYIAPSTVILIQFSLLY